MTDAEKLIMTGRCPTHGEVEVEPFNHAVYAGWCPEGNCRGEKRWPFTWGEVEGDDADAERARRRDVREREGELARRHHAGWLRALHSDFCS